MQANDFDFSLFPWSTDKDDSADNRRFIIT